jgi:SpoIID/LytB domain protein
MRIFHPTSSKPFALAALLMTTGGATWALSQHRPIVEPERPTPAPPTVRANPRQTFSLTTSSLQTTARPSLAQPMLSQPMLQPTAKLVALAAPLPARTSRTMRVGLTTMGGPIVLVSSSPMSITDSGQGGRRIVVPAGQNVLFNIGALQIVQAHGLTFSGNISVQTGGLSYVGWKVPRVQSSGITRMATEGSNPIGRRGYHGSFEIAPQTFSFEPSMHKSPLRVVNILTLEQYLDGVVPWEMDKSAPMEALKAQAICARSETLAKIAVNRHTADGFDICDYDHCQGYSGTENENERTNRAVDETFGLIITQNGRVADAVYGTNAGGVTSSSEDVWRGTPEPYLKSVRDFSPQRHPAMAKLLSGPMTEAKWAKYCTTNLPSFSQPSQEQIRALAERRRRIARTAALFQPGDLPEFYRWTRVLTPAQMAVVLKAAGAVATEVRVLERAPSGHIKRLQVAGRDPRGAALFATYEKDSQIRAMFSGRLGSTTALPSSTFVVIPRRDANKKITAWVFKGAGWGHGAGMCQRGAQNHALDGWSAQRILQWYFRGVTLTRVS